MNKVKDFTLALTGTIVRVALLILAIICIMNYAGKAYEFGYRIFAEEPMSEAPGRDISFVVNSSDSQKEIIQMLEDKGIIRDAKIFTVQKKLSIYKDDIEPGSYTLNTSMTNEEILMSLCGDEDSTDGLATAEELSEITDLEAGGITGLEEGGVLSEEGDYDESVAFEDDSNNGNSNGNSEEFDGEGDEESAIEE